MTAAEGKRTSPWLYVALGCGLTIFLAVAGLAAVAFFGYRAAKKLEADMKDPAARAARVQKVLGGQELPSGYHAVIGLSIPFVLDMAILSDTPPDAKGEVRQLGQRGFFYFKTLSRGQDQHELRDYFEGRSDDADVLRRHRIRIRTREIIRRGSVPFPDHTLLYLAQRGDLSLHDDHRGGITSLMFIQCPQDKNQRLGIWFGPDPAPEQPVGSVDFSGTQADEAAIRDFMSHFRPCGGAATQRL